MLKGGDEADDTKVKDEREGRMEGGSVAWRQTFSEERRRKAMRLTKMTERKGARETVVTGLRNERKKEQENI